MIARPFTGVYPHFTRTANRHDFSLEPPGVTMLDLLREQGRGTVAVGKISDIFAGRGVSRAIPTKGNADGMAQTRRLENEDFRGLCFVNLVDFDMLYGHRNDVAGYAAAIAAFDGWLAGFLPHLGADDVLMITADHGCDPATPSTDHSREYIPLLVYGEKIAPVPLARGRVLRILAKRFWSFWARTARLRARALQECSEKCDNLHGIPTGLKGRTLL